MATSSVVQSVTRRDMKGRKGEGARRGREVRVRKSAFVDGIVSLFGQLGAVGRPGAPVGR